MKDSDKKEVVNLFMNENDNAALEKLYEITHDKLVEILMNWKHDYQDSLYYAESDSSIMYNDIIEYVFEKYELDNVKEKEVSNDDLDGKERYKKVSEKEGLDLIDKLEKGEDIREAFYFQNENGIYNVVDPTSNGDKYYIEAFKNETIAKKWLKNEDLEPELLSLEDDLITLYDEEDSYKVTEGLKYNLLAVEETEGHSIVSEYSSMPGREIGDVFQSLLRDMEMSDCDSFGDLVENIKTDIKLDKWLESKILDEEPHLVSQDRLESGILVKLINSGEYFEVHTTPTGFNYTLYDKDKNDRDGGLKLYRYPEVHNDYLPLQYVLQECAAMIGIDNDLKLENIVLYPKGTDIEDDLSSNVVMNQTGDVVYLNEEESEEDER